MKIAKGMLGDGAETMVMRWKILELAENSQSLDILLKKLQEHPEYGLSQEGGVQLLAQYVDILPQPMQNELQSKLDGDSD